MGSKNDISVIIRSAGERTESVCKKMILGQGISPTQITVIHEVPFSASLRRSLELGIQYNKKWTLCVDADVLLRHRAIDSLLEKAENESEQLIEMQGLILDKLFCIYRPAGNHIYRTKHLEKALNNIPEEGSALKPETTMLHNTIKNGLYYRQTDVLMGLHDYEQFHLDIARKCFLHAHKNTGLAEAVEKLWVKKSKNDFDFTAALWGFLLGKIFTGTVFVSKHQGMDEITELFQIKKINEKQISFDSNFDKIEKAIEEFNWERQNDKLLIDLQQKFFPSSRWNEIQDGTVKSNVKIQPRSSLYKIGAYIEAFGKRIKAQATKR